MKKTFLNPEGYQNPISGSKVTVILLKGLIFPIGGVASGRVCACSLRSRLVFTRVGIFPRTDFRCLSRSEIGHPLFWNNQFELIFHNVFPKTNRFSSLVTEPLRNFFLRTFFNFCRFFEFIHLLNRVFHTYILSNAAETLQFGDLAVSNRNLKKYVCIL